MTSSDPNVLLQSLWARLEQAPNTHRDPYRVTNMATVDAEGRPENRMVVLRKASATHRRLSMFSDSAASKCASLQKSPMTAFCFWDASTRTQVRMLGQSKLVSGQAVQTEWAAVRPREQDRYRIRPTPGTQIPDPNAYSLDSDVRFTRIDCTVDQIDMLWLGDEGHTRLQATWRDGLWRLDWVTP